MTRETAEHILAIVRAGVEPFGVVVSLIADGEWRGTVWHDTFSVQTTWTTPVRETVEIDTLKHRLVGGKTWRSRIQIIDWHVDREGPEAYAVGLVEVIGRGIANAMRDLAAKGKAS